MTIDRKAATLAYKERKAVAGIYAVRCRASGQAWVGQTADLEKIENRLKLFTPPGRPSLREPAIRFQRARHRKPVF